MTSDDLKRQGAYPFGLTPHRRRGKKHRGKHDLGLIDQVARARLRQVDNHSIDVASRGCLSMLFPRHWHWIASTHCGVSRFLTASMPLLAFKLTATPVHAAMTIAAMRTHVSLVEQMPASHRATRIAPSTIPMFALLPSRRFQIPVKDHLLPR